MNRGPRGRVAVLGGGGHAKVVVSALTASGYADLVIFDDDPDRWGTSLLGVDVYGPVSNSPPRVSLRRSSPSETMASGGMWRARFPNVAWLTLIHPAAYVDPSARLGAGTVVFAGATIQPDVHVGSHVVINTSASVDHDCVIEDYVHLAPGVHLAGGVSIGRGAFLGIGCAVIPQRRVGEWTTVGAGGVVTRDLADGVLAIGVPARERPWAPTVGEQAVAHQRLPVGSGYRR